MQEKKSKIEAIYPLSFLQQALLFHSLQEGHDEGFLQVQCVFRGTIDIARFQEAWRKNFQRHESLRTSIHWENLEKPVQVVHKEVSLPFAFFDWSASAEHEQKAEFEALKRRDSEEAIDLTKTPAFRLFLIKSSEDKHFLMLSCHHILADGWSASVLLRDFIALYSQSIEGAAQADLPTVPSHKSYLNWIASQDKTSVADFWTEALRGFETPTLIAKPRYRKRVRNDRFETVSVKISEESSQRLREVSKYNQVTLNTLIQGLWGLVLSRYTEQNDVAFGAIASGRAVDLPNAELMAGMYMNILPSRVKIDPGESVSAWLKGLQLLQSRIRGYEYVSLDEVANSISSLNGKPLFDSIFVFENMPLANISGDDISIESFKSGLTSNYPMTLAVSPLNEIELHFKYDSSSISQNHINWFSNNLRNLMYRLIQTETKSLEDLIKCVTPSERITTYDKVGDLDENTENETVAPRNAVEFKLKNIWETLLNRQPISVTEDFFDYGGTSIIAIRLFTEIERHFGRKLQPISLLRHRTIRELSQLIEDKSNDKPWSSIVALRDSGSKRPIFCLHAAGGQVFFYRDFAKLLGDDQPVYALQRFDLDGTPVPQDIETMAAQYLDEIRKVQVHGPYALLGYCFSTPICWELARQIKDAGESVSLVAIIDSAPFVRFRGEPTIIDRIQRIADKTRALDFSFIKTIWQGRIKKPLKAKLTSFSSIQNENRFQQSVADSAESERMSTDKSRQEALVQSLGSTFNSYVWKPLPIKITLIRSWTHEPVKEFCDLALNGVETVVLDGHHSKLFDHPEVIQFAGKMKQILDKANK